MARSGFAVVDIETTGLNPWRHHRIIEIAIVNVARDGSATDEFETLVNPERDIGAQHVHGLSAEELRHAPRFTDVAGYVIERLNDRVVVGHNVVFDANFLEREFQRAGIAIPGLRTLCTMRLFGGSLASCCESFGIEQKQAHSAIDDARATANLLLTALRQGLDVAEATYERQGSGITWPALTATMSPLRRREVTEAIAQQPHFLARLVTRLHEGLQAGEGAGPIREYEGLLDRVLEDFVVSEEEAEALFRFACDFGLSADQMARAHVAYLKRLAAAAVEDGQLTDTEQRDLQKVSRLLGCDVEVLNRALADAWDWHTASGSSSNATTAKEDLRGKTVCFTGELATSIDGELISREMAHELAADRGLIIKTGVTKSLDLLVVADPHSMSGKAKKARDYGVRIMADSVFWRAIDVQTD